MNNIKTKHTSLAAPTIGIVEWFQPNEHARVEKVLAELKELDVAELRTGISWADYYTPSGKEWYDWLIPTLAQQVKVLPCFLYTPPSLGEVAKTSSPPRDLKAFADFLDIIITDLG
ncbi:MAG: NAD-dependent dehydratase, partial [Rufibacter sp.]